MQTRVIVLAAGKGTRMNAGTPKVLMPLNGQPMIQYLLDAIRRSGADPRPVLVVGYEADLLRRALGDKYDYVYQAEQLGTGHAVICAETLLRGKAENILVLYSDHPFVRPETIIKLRDLHRREGRAISMLTVRVPDFEDWRTPFADFGRVVRDEGGNIAAVMEVKDATQAELQIREVNPSFFCFRAEWLWNNLHKLQNNNAKGEYYLTDLVRIAIDQGEPIAAMDINPREALGVNTPEHLDIARGRV